MTNRYPAAGNRKRPMQGKKECLRSAVRGKRHKRDRRSLRRLFQLGICSAAFLLLTAANVLASEETNQLRKALSQCLHRNLDVEAVFSAAGQRFSTELGESELVRAVFGRQEPMQEDTEEQGACAASERPTEALTMLKDCSRQLAMGGQKTATAICPLTSEQPLPAQVSMEQRILGFAYGRPVEGQVSSGFGYREHPVSGERRFHYGVDLAAEQGAEIRSFAQGQVAGVGESSSYGKYCIIEHEGGVESLYAHCSRITVQEGERVSLGQKLGEVGATGMTTGAHLHFELHQNGVYLNPIYYVG